VCPLLKSGGNTDGSDFLSFRVPLLTPTDDYPSPGPLPRKGETRRTGLIVPSFAVVRSPPLSKKLLFTCFGFRLQAALFLAASPPAAPGPHEPGVVLNLSPEEMPLLILDKTSSSAEKTVFPSTARFFHVGSGFPLDFSFPRMEG